MTAVTNWSGNYTYRAARIHRPDSVEQLQELVAGADRVKALGSRHCFNDIADTSGDLIDTTGLPAEIVVDDGSVTAGAATKYGELAAELDRRSLALANLASLPHICIAGAIATGTHGSGVSNPGLADAVGAIELVTGDGELLRLSRDDEMFPGAVVGLGALGVIVRVTLDVQPTYRMRQDVFEHLPWDQLAEHFDAIMRSAYSVSLFTDWRAPRVAQVWCKSRLDAGESIVHDVAGRVIGSFFGATPATEPRHPLPGLSGQVCTRQLGVPGPWFERLPHFRLAFTPSNGDEVQSEYLVPRDHAAAVIEILRGLSGSIAPLLQIAEIRRVAPDQLWLSPAYRQDSVAFHFTWVNDEPAVRRILPVIESEIAAFGARPHWGKLFAADAETLAARYPRLPDFRALAGRLDPDGKFGNDFLDRHVFTGARSPAAATG